MDLKDFNDRWQKARLSAIEQVLQNPEQSGMTRVLPLALREEHLLGSTPAEKKDEVLRAVFLNSRKLAQSFSQHQGLLFEIQDFQLLVQQSGIPCFQGLWESRNNALVLTRGACSYASEARDFACTYWREALDGLVMGLGEEERSARHGCSRVDGGACVDVLFVEANPAPGKSVRYGVIPPMLVEDLEQIKEQFTTSMKTEVEFVGYSAGTLYFHFPKGTSCGSGAIYTSALLSKIQTKHPYIQLQDISPRAVLGVES
ncbi:hypothetical protein [Bdellovibrio sp.]|jgi:hypothetical protein|uniref:hypothetical protein n=1 Tax=Bdellovibrio sp. TaxID=28201 RepID=UPI0032217EAE